MRVVRAVARKSSGSAWRGNIVVTTFVLLSILLLLTSWSAYQSSQERSEFESARIHAMKVLRTGGELRIGVLGMVRGERGYLITGDRLFLEPLEEGRRIAAVKLAELDQLVANDAEQDARLALVRNEYKEFAAQLSNDQLSTGAINRAAPLELARQTEIRRTINRIFSVLEKIEQHEETALAARSTAADARARTGERYQYALSGIGLVLLLLSMLAMVGLRRAVAAEAAIREELRRIVMTDELTGVASRRELLAALGRAISGARRNARPLSFAIIDIDHFKRVNDTHGHPAGDAVIRHVATMATQIVRGQDTFGRLGGEEFAIILPDCRPDAALEVCERLRAAIHGEQISVNAATIAVTISTGIASFEPGDDAESLMARADTAMYGAKNSGRDRVQLAA